MRANSAASLTCCCYMMMKHKNFSFHFVFCFLDACIRPLELEPHCWCCLHLYACLCFIDSSFAVFTMKMFSAFKELNVKSHSGIQFHQVSRWLTFCGWNWLTTTIIELQAWPCPTQGLNNSKVNWNFYLLKKLFKFISQLITITSDLSPSGAIIRLSLFTLCYRFVVTLNGWNFRSFLLAYLNQRSISLSFLKVSLRMTYKTRYVDSKFICYLLISRRWWPTFFPLNYMCQQDFSFARGIIF